MRLKPPFAVCLFPALISVAGLALLTGCEDGPGQTFSPAPANAGNLWNNGNPEASVTDAPASFDAAFGSVSALQHCTADEQRLVWANMLEQPIIPPLRFAGLNLAYDEQFDGISLKEAEAINCTGNSLGPGGVSWGDNGEVEFFYTTSNYTVNAIVLSLGYEGKMTFTQAPNSRFDIGGKSPTYVVQLGQPIYKTNPTTGVTSILEIDWQDIGANTVLNEIFNGMMFTFGQDLGAPANQDFDTNDCTQDGNCLQGPPSQAQANGGICYMGFLPMEGFLLETDCSVTTQPTISIPIGIQQQYYLSEPSSYLGSILAISAEGPVSVPTPGVAGPQSCYLQVGMDWATYIANCVDLDGGTRIDPEVADSGLVGDASKLTINQVNEAKSTAAHTHDTETYQFNVVGITLNWTDEVVEQNPQAIVQDNDLPSLGDNPQAIINQWDADLYDNGLPQNDTDSSGGFTGIGTAHVYREWIRLTQADLNNQLAAYYPNRVQTSGPNAGSTIYNHQIGDPACFVPPAQAFALGCTGLEGIAIGSGPYATTIGDAEDACPASPPANGVLPSGAAPICSNLYAGGYFSAYGATVEAGGPYSTEVDFGAPGYGDTVLRPGNDLVIFCQNPATTGLVNDPDPTNGNCSNFGPTWETALTQVQMVAGQGSLNNLPLQVADRRYYFRWYGIAMIKYFKAYGAMLVKDGNPFAPGLGSGGNKGANVDTTATVIANQPIDMESIFFDSQNDGGGSTYDNVEYIDRSYMIQVTSPVNYWAPGISSGPGEVSIQPGSPTYQSPNEVATDFAFGSDTYAANQRSTNWARFMYRQETAMFQAMLTDKVGLACTPSNAATQCAPPNSPAQYHCAIDDATNNSGHCAPLPGSQNNVNITNLAGNALLQQDYGSYECATQYPTVTIEPRVTGDAPITGSWEDVCGHACPAISSLFPLTCPLPPLMPAIGANPPTLQLDQNGTYATLGGTPLGLGGTNPRLAAYPSVWGRGAACEDTVTESGFTDAQLDPTGPAQNNPYNTIPCGGTGQNAYAFANGFPFATAVGSVFAVGNRDPNAARIQYVGANANNPNQGTSLNTLTAYVQIPNMTNPYNAITLTTDVTPNVALSPILVTAPWINSYDGVGFEIPLNATENKFIQTQQIGFYGILETYLLDVVPYINPVTKVTDGTLEVEAIEGDDFLGEAFLCQDLGNLTTPGTGDLLGAHMYDSAASILDWITAHPGSQDACNIIVRYSIYDNYVDYITSMNAGVELDINQGGGYGRVVGVVAFDPTLAFAP
jgi:hypothetical protein